jgi:hypothetical protein
MHVEPRATEDELHVVREVEYRGDEGEAEQEEENRVWCELRLSARFDTAANGSVMGAEKETVDKGEGPNRTENKLLDWREDVDAIRHLQLVYLELDPFAQGLEVGRHGCSIRTRAQAVEGEKKKADALFGCCLFS